MHIMVLTTMDGPIPGEYSLLSITAVVIDKQMDKVFHKMMRPESPEVKYKEEYLESYGYTREETLGWEDPHVVLKEFEEWTKQVLPDVDKPCLVAEKASVEGLWLCYNYYKRLGVLPFKKHIIDFPSMFKGLAKNAEADIDQIKNSEVNEKDPMSRCLANTKAFVDMVCKGGISGLPLIKKDDCSQAEIKSEDTTSSSDIPSVDDPNAVEAKAHHDEDEKYKGYFIRKKKVVYDQPIFVKKKV